MANYATTNSTNFGAVQVANTTTDISLISIFASTIAPMPAIQLRRAKVYDILVGTNGTPADNAMMFSMQRATAGSTPSYAGINSSVNQALDQADSVSACGSWSNSSMETSYTYTGTNMPWFVGVNQRASYRWVAAPGSEIVLPATSSAGLSLRSKSPGYTGAATGALMWSE